MNHKKLVFILYSRGKSLTKSTSSYTPFIPAAVTVTCQYFFQSKSFPDVTSPLQLLTRADLTELMISPP